MQGRVTDLDRAYAAGFFDGEGSVTISYPVAFRNSQKGWQVGCSVSQLDPAPLRWLQERWGGSVNGPRRNGQYDWRIHSAQVDRFLADIGPFLIVKGEAAAILVEFRQKVFHHVGSRGLPEDEIARRRRLHQELQAANRRGRRWETAESAEATSEEG